MSALLNIGRSDHQIINETTGSLRPRPAITGLNSTVHYSDARPAGAAPISARTRVSYNE